MQGSQLHLQQQQQHEKRMAGGRASSCSALSMEEAPHSAGSSLSDVLRDELSVRPGQYVTVMVMEYCDEDTLLSVSAHMHQ